MAKCTGTKRETGEQCKANAKGATGYCRWHSKSPDDVEAHAAQSRKGGEAKAAGYAPLHSTTPLTHDPALADADFSTPKGLRALYSAQLRALTSLPFDARISAAITQAGMAQRAQIETSELADKLEAFDAFIADQKSKR